MGPLFYSIDLLNIVSTQRDEEELFCVILSPGFIVTDVLFSHMHTLFPCNN